MNLKDATYRWVQEMNSYPLEMMIIIAQDDYNDWCEVTTPSSGERVYVYDTKGSSEHLGEIEIVDNGRYVICLDDGEKIKCTEGEFSVETEGTFPMWGWMWSFSDSADEYWMEEMDGIRKISECGFRVFKSGRFGFFFGIDGAGYDFYESHWIPLYKSRGLQWHDKEEE